MILVGLSCAWLLGIFIGWYFNLPWFYCFIGIVPLLLMFILKQYRKILLILGLAVIILPLAAGFAYGELNEYDNTDLRFYNDRGLTQLRGVISESPDVRDNNTRLRVEVEEIYIDDEWISVNGKRLVFVPRYPVYEYGNFISIIGEPETPPQLGDFDYRCYLSSQGIYTTMFHPGIGV